MGHNGGTSGSSIPARAVSVDEASLALANLLEIDEGGASRNSNSRRVYQHALSVRVPPNQQQGNSGGAVPRRHTAKSKGNNNQNEENN